MKRSHHYPPGHHENYFHAPHPPAPLPRWGEGRGFPLFFSLAPVAGGEGGPPSGGPGEGAANQPDVTRS
jgi:hypothetical protein